MAFSTIGGWPRYERSAMAIAIGYALQAPPLVLFSLAVGCGLRLQPWAARAAPWPCCSWQSSQRECGKAVSKETKIDILVTPIVTTLMA